MPAPPPPPSAFERVFERWLFRSRWLLAPIYAGMVVTLAALVVVFGIEMKHTAEELFSEHPKYTLVSIIQLVDVSLAASLVLVVVLSGYRNFISEGRPDEPSAAPRWLADIDFAGLKLKLMSSLIAISGVALLKAFVELTDDQGGPTPTRLAWMIGIHMTFVVSALLLALTDLLKAKSHDK
jgi:uncharacterized protein (TIGR00645 family)